MFSLLPFPQKKEVRREYFRRLFTVMFLVFFLVILVSLLLLVPSYFLARLVEEDKTRESEAVRNSEIFRRAAIIENELSALGKKLEILGGRRDSSLVEDITAVLKERSAGIRVTDISVRTAGEEREMVFVGVAANRDDLLGFERDVRATKRFSSVRLPVSNFAKDRNVDFQLTVRAPIDQ